MAVRTGREDLFQWIKSIAYVATGWMQLPETLKYLNDGQYQDSYKIADLRLQLNEIYREDEYRRQQESQSNKKEPSQQNNEVTKVENKTPNQEVKEKNVTKKDIVDNYMELRQTNTFNKQNMQSMAITSWITYKLKPLKHVEIDDVAEELSDGTVICLLVEQLTGEKMENKKLNPTSSKDKFDNVNNAVSKLSNYLNIPYPQELSIPQFISGNIKSILDFCWWIVYNTSIQPIQFVGLKGRFALLAWTQEQISNLNVTVEDFNSSFSDGLALCALIYSIDPTAINFPNLNKIKRVDNIRQALTVSSRKFTIPLLLDTTDFDNLDDATMIIYLSYFYYYTKNNN